MAVLLSLVLFLCGCLTGVWTLECVVGQYNENDECTTCPTSCSRCISNIICTACKPGFYGYSCTKKCSESCANGICLQENGQCVSCKGGYYFSGNKTCAECPEHCIFCQSINMCTSCKMGFTGTVCQEECTNCNPVSGCNIETKICTAGCIDGYTGFTCLERCASRCKSCDPVDADYCRSCADGRYGSNCDKSCPTNCKDNVCSEDNGFCIRGCEIGSWGNQCENKCSERCLEDVCFKSNGTCLKGCVGNFTGYKCLCPSKCECELDGTCKKCSNESDFLCDDRCSSACINNICSSGLELKCFYGCREDKKSSLCSPDMIYKNSDATPSKVAGLVMAPVSAVVVVAVIVVFCIVRWRKRAAIQRNSASSTSNEEGSPFIAGASSGTHASFTETATSNIEFRQTSERRKRTEKLQRLLKSIKTRMTEDYIRDFKNLPNFLAKDMDNQHHDVLPCSTTHFGGSKFGLNYSWFASVESNAVTVMGKKEYRMNGSFIKDKTGTVKYIACEGPTNLQKAGFTLFWTMLLQHNCKIVVMLYNIERHRNSKRKSAKFWPNRRSRFGDLSVRCLKYDEYETLKYNVMTFNIKTRSDVETVTILHYTDWPEKGCTENLPQLLDFRQAVNDKKPNYSGPLVVVSRNGVGRTGTYIALDMLLSEVDDTTDSVDSINEEEIDVFTCVMDLRQQRKNMVETESQYKFIYEALFYYISRILKVPSRNDSEVQEEQEEECCQFEQKSTL